MFKMEVIELNALAELNEVTVTGIKGAGNGFEVTVKTKHDGKATLQCLVSSNLMWLKDDGELFVATVSIHQQFHDTEQEHWWMLPFGGKPLTLSRLYGALNTGKPINLVVYRGWIVDACMFRSE